MMCRTLQLLAAVTMVVLGPSPGCAYGVQQQEVGGSKNTGNDQQQEATVNEGTSNNQQEQAEDTNGQHQADCAADRYSDAIYIMNSHGSDPTLVRKLPEGYEMDIAWQ